MTPRRLKTVLLIAGLAAAGVALLSWTQTWFLVTLTTGQELVVAGDAAAGALAALALSGVVLTGALSIAGPVFRAILGVLEAVIGVLVAASGLAALSDPQAAVAGTITDATAVSGEVSVRELVVSLTSTAWPAVAVAAGILLALAGVAVTLTLRRWPDSSRRYRGARFEPASGERSAVGDWDALSDGRDPTSPGDDAR